jgi:2-dehydro-3-deoxyphosphogluconate aldolase/(4S)-4-hydroxy-2-oxoglutarate aldolase
VKLFPASAIGPAFVRELRGPMPDVELIPTGGIDASDAAAFLAAGAVAVGIGTAIVRADPATRRTIVASLASRPWPGAEGGPGPGTGPGAGSDPDPWPDPNPDPGAGPGR